MQKLNNGQYFSDIFLKDFANTHLDELKQFESKITPEDDLFDSWITLILKAFKKNSPFDGCLKIAKERGEHAQASPMAQYNLGLMNKYGEGVGQDFKKAIELFEKSANQGYANAQCVLGVMYHTALGVEQNFTKAFDYYQKAADQNNVNAQCNLGYLYKTGQGVAQNSIKAIKLYKKSANQGCANAQCELGFIYYQGQGTHQNLIKAFKYLKEAADQEHDGAQNNLGIMYQYGQGVDQDLMQAFKQYLKSSKNKCTIDDLKINLKSLVTFVPSTITLEDEKNLIKNQETLINNIEAFLGLHGMEKGINVSYDSKEGADKLTLCFKESYFAIPSLFKNYSEIVDFEEFLLKSIPAFDQPGFMVTCLQPNDIEPFKSSNCPDIKYYELQGKSFLTFGQDNIEAANKLMPIFDQSHPAYDAISDILGTLTEINKSFETETQMSDLAQALKTQYISRLTFNAENKTLGTIQISENHTLLMEKVKQDIDVLTQLQAIPQQLIDLLIEGAPVRNKLFLQNNDYIEPIFKD